MSGYIDLETISQRDFVYHKPPTHGRFVKGDRIWNTEPSAGGYIGWVCVVSGDFGDDDSPDPEFLPFGLIGVVETEGTEGVQSLEDDYIDPNAGIDVEE